MVWLARIIQAVEVMFYRISPIQSQDYANIIMT